MATPNKPISWGAFVVSLFILCLFSASVLGYAPNVSDATAHLLETAVTLVLGYWLGSSAGSADKADRLADIAAAQTGSTFANTVAPPLEAAAASAVADMLSGKSGAK